MSLNPIFSDSRRLVPTWFFWWNLSLFLSILLGVAGILTGEYATSVFQPLFKWTSNGGSSLGIINSPGEFWRFKLIFHEIFEKHLPVFLLNASLLVLLILSILDIIMYSIKINRPIKKALCSMVFDEDEDYLKKAKKKIKNILIVNCFIFLFVLLTIFVFAAKWGTVNGKVKPMYDAIEKINWIKTVGWSIGSVKFAFIHVSTVLSILVITSFALKIKFKKYIGDCFCFYSKKNLWFFFDGGNETTKVWLGLWNFGFFLSILSIIGFFIGYFYFSQKRIQDGTTKAGIAGSFGGLLMCMISSIEYMAKERRSIRMAINSSNSDEETFNLKQISSSINILSLITALTKLVSGGTLGTIIYEFASKSQASEAWNSWQFLVIIGCSACMLIGWLSMLSMQLKIKRQFREMRQNENVRFGASLNF